MQIRVSWVVVLESSSCKEKQMMQLGLEVIRFNNNIVASYFGRLFFTWSFD